MNGHFPSKNGQKRQFFGQNLNFFAFSQAVEDPPPPILRVLDANKQVVGTHRSGKHNLQHPYAPKFPVFHGKNGKKWLLFGQKLSFSASDKQLKTPRPILRVLDANKQVLERDRSRKHNLQHTFFMKKRPRMAVFGQKLSFSASDKHLKTPPPPISRVLDAKEQVLGRHTSGKHNLQHAYAPTFVIFHEKNGQEWPFFWSKIEFFGARQAFEDPPSHFAGAGCKKAGCKGTQMTKTQFAASVCTKTSHFS